MKKPYIKVTIEKFDAADHQTAEWRLWTWSDENRPFEAYRDCIVSEFAYKWRQVYGPFPPAIEAEA